MEKVIAVAMSGGVDSSLTAAMLLKQGYKVFGITLWLWVSGTPYDEVPLAVTDAKKMCDFLGIEHHVIDARRCILRECSRLFRKRICLWSYTKSLCIL